MKSSIRYLLIGCCVIGTASADRLSPARQEPIVETDADLRSLCEYQSHADLVSKGQTPYNFTASVWSEVNTIRVKGSWRVGTKDAAVECSIERGSPARYASVTIRDPR